MTIKNIITLRKRNATNQGQVRKIVREMTFDETKETDRENLKNSGQRTKNRFWTHSRLGSERDSTTEEHTGAPCNEIKQQIQCIHQVDMVTEFCVRLSYY